MNHSLRFPIGDYSFDGNASVEQYSNWIDAIEAHPAELRAAVQGLNDAQLDTRYRPDGWTVRQVVHHLADSHMNSYIRFKLGMTESEPTIRPYNEALWAELDDARIGPLNCSLNLIEALHERWGIFLRSMHPEDFKRSLIHPEIGTERLEWFLGFYAWHGKHHVAHITSLRDREQW